MNPLPPLSDQERDELRASIKQDGIQYPVLLDRVGRIIDGFHRTEIAAELGVDCPTKTLDVDEETAERLCLALNLARRHLSTASRYELIVALAEKHEAAAVAEAKERMAAGGRGGNEGMDTVSIPSSKGTSRDVIAERINADLVAAGRSDIRVNGRTVERARKYVRDVSKEDREAVRTGEKPLWSVHPYASHPKGKKTKKKAKKTGLLKDRPGRDQELGELARIRAIDAERQYNSMLNAPPQKLNLPLIRRAEKIMEMLTELIALDPAVAASQLPIERCREFTVAHAAWWSEFARLCEERRAAETPDLPPRPFRPLNAVLNPVVLGTSELPTEERALSPGERAALDWIRAQGEPVTATQVAVGLRNRSKQTIQLRIRKLTASGLVEPAGKAGQETAYQAVEQ